MQPRLDSTRRFHYGFVSVAVNTNVSANVPLRRHRLLPAALTEAVNIHRRREDEESPGR
ncbi:hypothetical protein DES32_2918 [Methylovirgula ligni]|uniref:Uncharacterized protein n=1 Tax=Methylovirgula ligni TaxID=569860 RepID=A0A3D9YRE7_9HYPH|nr:hypothetical protein DES32_2918 [Methylovirgula ligni]